MSFSHWSDFTRVRENFGEVQAAPVGVLCDLFTTTEAIGDQHGGVARMAGIPQSYRPILRDMQ